MDIKAIGIDIDGTLTDGTVFVDDDGNETLRFSRIDGAGIEYAKKAGIVVFAISKENSIAAINRMKKLDITSFHGIQDKRRQVLSFLEDREIPAENLAYIGDDLNDKKTMEIAGFSGCPPDAHLAIKSVAKYQCKAHAGRGAVREFIEKVLSINANNREGK